MKIFELDDLVKDGTIKPNMANINDMLERVGGNVDVELLPDGSNIGKFALAIIDSCMIENGGSYDMSLKGEFNKAIDYMFHEGASESYYNGILNEVNTNPIFK